MPLAETQKAGLPEGAINIVWVDGPRQTGNGLSESTLMEQDYDLRSTAVDRRMAEADQPGTAGEKNPNIVFGC